MLIKKINQVKKITWDKTGLGEDIFLKNFIKPEMKVFFDVGTRFESHIVTQLNNNDRDFHLFEPNPKFYNVLKKKYEFEHNIIVNNVGLGDVNSSLEYFEKSESFINRRLLHQNSPGKILEILTLEKYCKLKKIDSIDFLKIDTEGFELKVLRGAKNIIDKCKIIQFEYGGTYIDAQITLKNLLNEVFNMSKEINWKIYMIQSDFLIKIDLKDIERFETFRYSNFVISQKELHDN